MKSLLIRFFLAFWLIIGITISIAAISGYWYAESVRNAYENFALGDSMLEASAALNSAGREGLTIWLKNFPEARGLQILVLDRSGKDLLNRPVPGMLRRMLSHKRQLMRQPDRLRNDPKNLMRARPLSQLIGPDGQRYTFIVTPPGKGLLFGRALLPRSILLALALAVSALVSLLLARAMSRPVRELRDATKLLAEGNFDSQVASSVGRRKDELGLLARDFDTMADNLRRSAAQQIELARNVSHELRSPLARLRVALALARRHAGDLPEFDRIDVETESIDNLIEQILSYTRLESIAEQDKQVTSLNEIISDVVADVNYECQSDGIDGVSVASELTASIDMRIHEQSIKSAIENIVRNAVRHTRPNTQVSVKLLRESSEIVKIIIDDFGPGVPEEDLQQLFEAFFRTRKPGNNKPGTGLGLAIARRAIKMHGGTIVACNRADGGLQVTIELPG